jgi:hypothetical protein
MLAQLPGLTVCDPEVIPFGPADAGDGSLVAGFDLDERCERIWSVLLEDLVDGDFDLYVGASGPFTIEVVEVIEGSGLGSGEIIFSTEPEEGEEPLTFDPRGETMQLFDGEDLIFEDVFPAS